MRTVEDRQALVLAVEAAPVRVRPGDVSGESAPSVLPSLEQQRHVGDFRCATVRRDERREGLRVDEIEHGLAIG